MPKPPVEELLSRAPPQSLKEAQDQHREMLDAMHAIRHAQLLLEQADLRKNEFLSVLGHELRNPLATLNMTIAIMRRKTPITPEDVAQRCDVMTRQVSHLVRLIDELTHMTRAEKARAAPHEAPVEINALAKDALELADPAIRQRRHVVVFEPADHEVRVQGDAPRLLQVLGNVLENAIRYTPESGRITLKVRAVESDAVIEVADNGEGIDAEMLPQVFGMFVQARGRAVDESAGLGIGLTLAERLVRAHGGTIQARSEGLGRGSRFTIRLPLLQA